MTPIRLDFHPRARTGGRARAAAWGVLAAVALASAALAAHVARLADAATALDARRELLEARLHPAAARTEVPGPELARRVAADNAVIAQLAVPWDTLFDAIESADARGLGITSLQPDARERTLRLGGEARSVPDVLAWVDRLAALPVLEHVRLQGYETVARDGVDVVAFTVAATWRLP